MIIPVVWTTAQAAAAWGVSPRQAWLYCTQGRVPGALKSGRDWQIPADAPKPSPYPEGGAAHRKRRAAA